MLPCLQAKPTNKSVVELVKEATGASEEDVKHTLEECDYDVNKATNMLIDGETLHHLELTAVSSKGITLQRPSCFCCSVINTENCSPSLALVTRGSTRAASY
jgi:GBF-interacting protein 1 N-terminal